MTISVSEGGTYKQSEAMWVSSGGEWVEVSGTGGGAVGIELQGSPENGVLIISGPPGSKATLYARNYADGRVPVVELATSVIDMSGTWIAQPSSFPAAYRALISPSGFIAAIYYAVVGLDLTESIAIGGEARVSSSQFFAGGNYVKTEPASSNTVTSGGASTTTVPKYESFVTWCCGDYLSVSIPSYDFAQGESRLGSGWTAAAGVSHINTVFGSTEPSTITLFHYTSIPGVGGTIANEVDLQNIPEGLSPVIKANWEVRPGVTAHDGTANNWDRSGYWLESHGITSLYFMIPSCTYTEWEATIVKESATSLLVTGPVGKQVRVEYVIPEDFDTVPWTVSSLAKVLDANGETRFTPADFPTTVSVAAGLALDEFRGGIYTVASAINQPSVMIDGTFISDAYFDGFYDTIYQSSQNLSKYPYSSSGAGTVQVNDYSTSTDPYVYQYWIEGVNKRQLLYGWELVESQLLVIGTMTLQPKLYSLPSNSIVNGAPYPATETLWLDLAASNPAWATTGYSLVPWPSFLDTPGTALSGGCRGPNPGAPNTGTWGPTCGMSLALVQTVAFVA